MKVALLFFGICRSTNYTIESLKKCVFDPLKSFGLDYDIYLHTYRVNNLYSNNRSNEHKCSLNNELYMLLQPTYMLIENQEEVDLKLHLETYRTHGCPWKSHNFETLNNHIRALHSIKEVTNLMLSKNIHYDYVIFIRPDVKFDTPLSREFFTIKENEIILPDHSKYPINDRFAICSINVAKIYGSRFENALEYSRKHKLHSETFLKYTLDLNKITIIEKKIDFYRIRCNGYLQKN